MGAGTPTLVGRHPWRCCHCHWARRARLPLHTVFPPRGWMGCAPANLLVAEAPARVGGVSSLPPGKPSRSGPGTGLPPRSASSPSFRSSTRARCLWSARARRRLREELATRLRCWNDRQVWGSLGIQGLRSRVDHAFAPSLRRQGAWTQAPSLNLAGEEPKLGCGVLACRLLHVFGI